MYTKKMEERANEIVDGVLTNCGYDAPRSEHFITAEGLIDWSHEESPDALLECAMSLLDAQCGREPPARRWP